MTNTADTCLMDPYSYGCPQYDASTTTILPTYETPTSIYTYSPPPTQPPCPTGSLKVSVDPLTVTQSGTTSVAADNEPVYQWKISGTGTIVNDTTGDVQITSMEATVATQGGYPDTHVLDGDVTPTSLAAGDRANIDIYLSVNSTTEPALSIPWDLRVGWAGLAANIDFGFCSSPTVVSG